MDRIELADFRLRCRDFLVAEAQFLARVPAVTALLQQIRSMPPQNFEIITELRRILAELPGSDLVILAGGGLDSNVLIGLATDPAIGKTVHVLSCVTRDNGFEQANLAAFCQELGLGFERIAPTDAELEDEIATFRASEGRLPNDIAQPMVAVMCRHAAATFPGVPVVDGQYADTYMYSNPQNLYFRMTRPLSLLPGVGLFARMQKIGNKRIRHLLFCLAALPLKCLHLCGIQITPATCAAMRRLLQDNRDLPAETVMQAVFCEVMLHYRESDKYVGSPGIVSPFGTLALFFHCTHNIALYSRFRQTKIPLHRYFRLAFPAYYAGTQSRSFK
jgi:hypothetical protein